jgi:predicted dehydrogenase
MKKFGFGLIGCGAIARCHANAISDIENAKLVAVYDFNYDSLYNGWEDACSTLEDKINNLQKVLADKN